MAVSIGEIEATLKLKDQLTPALKVATAELKKAGAAIAGVGDTVALVGAGLSAGITLPLIAAANGVASFAAEFDKSMTRVEVLTGVSRDSVEAWRKDLLDLGPALGQTPQELAKGLYAVTSSGIKGAEALDILKDAAKASAIGLGDTNKIARTVSAAMQAYGKENLSAAQATAVMVEAVRQGNAEADAMADVFGRVIGVASQVGVSFDQVAAFVATFTRLGVKADEAVTALRGTLAILLKPSKQAQEALAEIGLTMADVRAQIKDKGLTAALIDLVGQFKGNEDQLAHIIPNIRALSGVLGTAGAQAEQFATVQEKVTKTMQNARQEIDNAFLRTTETLAFKWDQLKTTFATVATQLGQVVAPAFSKVLDFITPLVGHIGDMAKAWDALPPSIKSVVGALAAFVVAVGPVSLALGLMMSTLGRLGPMMLTFFGAGSISQIAAWGMRVVPAISSVTVALAAMPLALGAVQAALAGAAIATAFAFFDNRIKQMNDNLKTELDRLDKMSEDARLREKQASGLIDPKERKLAQDLNAEYDKLIATKAKLTGSEQVRLDPKQFEGMKLFGDMTIEVAQAYAKQRDAATAVVTIGKAVTASTAQQKDKYAELVEQLAKADAELKGLSATQRNDLAKALKSGAIDFEEIRKKVDISETALKLFQNRLRETSKESSAFQEAAKNVEALYLPMEQLSAAQEEGIKSALKLGGTQKDVATYFGVSEGAVKAMTKEMERDAQVARILAEVNNETNQTLAEMQKRMLDIANTGFSRNIDATVTAQKNASNILNRLYLNDYDYQVSLIKQEAAERKSALSSTSDYYNEALAAIDTETDVRMQEAARSWKEHLREMEESTASLGNFFRGWITSIPELLTSAFTGGGGISGAFKGLATKIGGDLGSMLFAAGGPLSALGGKLALGIGGAFGDALGMALPGIGQALGALAGALLPKIVSLFHKPEWQKFSRDLGRDWGVGISDGLAQQLEADSKKFGRQAAGLLNLDKIIEDVGGVQSFGGLDKVLSKMGDLFSMLETGKLTVAQVRDEFDKAFAIVLPMAVDKGTGLASKKLLDLIDTAHRFGIESQAIADFYSKMGDQVAKGFDAVVTGVFGPLNDAVDKLKGSDKPIADVAKGIKDLGAGGQDAFDRMGRLATSAFAAAVAGGKSFLDALDALGPGLDALIQAQQNFGYASSGAFDELMKFREFATTHKELVGELQGLNDMLVGLSNTGLLTQQTFDDIGDTAADAFKRMVDGGLSSDQALRLLGPTLQTIWQLQQDFGFTVDENTQKMIDQATEAGIVGEKHKDAAHQMVDAMQHVSDILEAIAKKLGADLPKAAADAAKGVNDALNGIKDKDVNVNVHTREDAPAGSGPGGLPNVPGFASGSGGMMDFGPGTMAMLHGREGVFTDSQMSALLSGSYAAGASGGTGGAQVIQLVVDGRVLTQVVNNSNDSRLRLRKKLRSA